MSTRAKLDLTWIGKEVLSRCEWGHDDYSESAEISGPNGIRRARINREREYDGQTEHGAIHPATGRTERTAAEGVRRTLGYRVAPGSRTVNCVPRPGSLVTSTVPWCTSTIRFAMARPSPAPRAPPLTEGAR